MASFLDADAIASLLEEAKDGRSAAAAPKPTSQPFKELRFLVVEDQEASRKTLKMCIQSMGGFHIDMAVSHGDAIYRIKNRIPDVIICDYILGDGRTGQQLLEELRRTELLPDRVVFLMVTAERSYEQVVSAVELTPDDYVIKPFSPEVLGLRIEKAVMKKIAFRTFYSLKESNFLDQAVDELNDMLGREHNKAYKYDIMRCRAETLARAGRTDDAQDAYEKIIEIHPFPWAKAGLARMLRLKDRLQDARTAIEDVITMAPNYFEAYDLKATICSEMGDYGAALQTLEHAAERTPRNWSRKRSLSTVALHSGDAERAAEVMREVVANDVVANNSLQDSLAMARCALAGGDVETAKAVMLAVPQPKIDAMHGMSGMEVIEFECVLSVIEGPAGASRFERIRRTIADQVKIPVETSVDIVRAAMAFCDQQMADRITEMMLASKQARHAFQPLLGVYKLNGVEASFRTIQDKAARRRLKK